MKCKRNGCKKQALPGKEYCGKKCSRADNIEAFETLRMVRNKEYDGDSDVLCACGCGLHLDKKQVADGIKFRNRVHSNRWKGKNKIGLAYSKLNEVFEQQKEQPKQAIGFNGKEYCQSFSPLSIVCMKCMEDAIFKYKSCYKERKK